VLFWLTSANMYLARFLLHT